MVCIDIHFSHLYNKHMNYIISTLISLYNNTDVISLHVNTHRGDPMLC